jgi:hypothetical protein
MSRRGTATNVLVVMDDDLTEPDRVRSSSRPGISPATRAMIPRAYAFEQLSSSGSRQGPRSGPAELDLRRA